MKKWMRMMMAFTAMLSLVALTGCNVPKEDSEPVAEESAAPAAEHPAESETPKDHPAH